MIVWCTWGRAPCVHQTKLASLYFSVVGALNVFGPGEVYVMVYR